ncbi:MAG TPA: exonuclease subunit SbcD, partial [Synergistaceae bacterium]|nr:exonuclease subunit SbcD [Synergistaceae bacterium]
MKLIHTSDWHLGRGLYEKKRYEEHEKFLDWLISRIEESAPELLIIAGDVFDTGTPSNRARELYYRFLCRMASSPCRHVVVVGGNHDSP